jgi:PD-(D/E)XK nuclease superfamily
MLFNETSLIRISQGQLKILEKCPRQFQHAFLEQLYSPIDPQHEEKQLLGSHFHLLMQQREIGLPINSFLEADAQLQSWMMGFAEVAPEVLEPASNESFKESEQYRTLQVENYLLTVIYDLLIADNHQAQILDWKTYPKPPNKSSLEKNWQTQLYLYVLAETSQYPPENISMTYWFVQPEGKPENIKFSYSTAQHEQTKKRLNQLLSKLTQWSAEYSQGIEFPQVLEGSKVCESCQFAVRCNRTYAFVDQVSTNNIPSLAVDRTLLELATIEEVRFLS